MASDTFYRTIEHTADIGIEVEAPDRAGIFTLSALAMFDLMFGLESIGHAERRKLRATGDDTGELLVAWLNEVLYVYSVEKLIFSRFRDEVLSDRCFSALGLGERFDPQRHSADMEIKAATYHEISVTRDNGLWRARVIFDV